MKTIEKRKKWVLAPDNEWALVPAVATREELFGDVDEALDRLRRLCAAALAFDPPSVAIASYDRRGKLVSVVLEHTRRGLTPIVFRRALRSLPKGAVRVDFATTSRLDDGLRRVVTESCRGLAIQCGQFLIVDVDTDR